MSDSPGDLIRALLKKHSLTYAQATLKTEGRVSRSYWASLTDGSQKPTQRIVGIISDAFPDDRDLTDALRLACGYAPSESPEIYERRAIRQAAEAASAASGIPVAEIEAEMAKHYNIPLEEVA